MDNLKCNPVVMAQSIYRATDERLEKSIREAEESRVKIQMENDMLEYYLGKKKCAAVIYFTSVCASFHKCVSTGTLTTN